MKFSIILTLFFCAVVLVTTAKTNELVDAIEGFAEKKNQLVILFDGTQNARSKKGSKLEKEKKAATFLVKAVDALNPIGKGEDDSQVGGVRIPDNIEFRLRSAKNVDGVIKKIKKVKLNDGNDAASYGLEDALETAKEVFQNDPRSITKTIWVVLNQWDNRAGNPIAKAKSMSKLGQKVCVVLIKEGAINYESLLKDAKKLATRNGCFFTYKTYAKYMKVTSMAAEYFEKMKESGKL